MRFYSCEVRVMLITSHRTEILHFWIFFLFLVVFRNLIYLLQLRTDDECDQNYNAPIANLTDDCVLVMGMIHL